MTCELDLKNLGKKKSKSSGLNRLVLIVETVALIALMWWVIASTPRAIDHALGIGENQRSGSEVTHRYLTPQQEYEKY